MVTKTHVLDLVEIYKKYKPEFDEIFFVVSNRGSSTETRIDSSYCQYDNVLCIEYEDLQFESKEEIEKVVHDLTNKFQLKFEVSHMLFFIVCERVFAVNYFRLASISLEQTFSATQESHLPFNALME